MSQNRLTHVQYSKIAKHIESLATDGQVPFTAAEVVDHIRKDFDIVCQDQQLQQMGRDMGTFTFKRATQTRAPGNQYTRYAERLDAANQEIEALNRVVLHLAERVAKISEAQSDINSLLTKRCETLREDITALQAPAPTNGSGVPF